MGLASTEQRRRAGQVELIRRRYGLRRNKRCLAVHTAAGRPNQALTDDDLSSEGRGYTAELNVVFYCNGMGRG